MKGIIKILAVSAAALCLSAGIASQTGCNGCAGGEQAYSGTCIGEYSYKNPYGDDRYGVKVSVEVEEDVIKRVVVLNSDYTEATEAMGKWNPETWDNNKATVLAKYAGKTVSEVMGIGVECDENGEPVTGTEENPVTYNGLIHTGATLSSGRLLKAVQNALSNR